MGTCLCAYYCYSIASRSCQCPCITHILDFQLASRSSSQIYVDALWLNQSPGTYYRSRRCSPFNRHRARINLIDFLWIAGGVCYLCIDWRHSLQVSKRNKAKRKNNAEYCLAVKGFRSPNKVNLNYWNIPRHPNGDRCIIFFLCKCITFG